MAYRGRNSVKDSTPVPFDFQTLDTSGLFLRITESRDAVRPGTLKLKVSGDVSNAPENPRCTITMHLTGIHMPFHDQGTRQNLFCMSVDFRRFADEFRANVFENRQ